MHLAIEAVGVKHGGGAHVLRRLLDALGHVASSRVRLTLFASPRWLRRFELPELEGDAPEVEIVDRPEAEGAIGRAAWLQAGLARACMARHVDAVICFNAIGHTAHLPRLNLIQQSLLFSARGLAAMPASFRARMAVIRAMTRASCQGARKVVTQTEVIATEALEAFGLAPERVVTITPDIAWLDPPRIGAAVGRLRSAPPGRRVLYVGSDSPHKSVDTLAEAVRRVRRSLPEATLFVTWPAAHPLCRRDGVEGLGTIRHDEVRAVLETATLLVMPSLAEAVGLPMMEAHATGCPVLAVDSALRARDLRRGGLVLRGRQRGRVRQRHRVAPV